MPKKHVLPSILIAIFLGMQMSTFVTGTAVWPWMGYAMYAYPKRPPVRHSDSRLYVVLEDGEQLDVDETSVGLPKSVYKDTMLQPISRGKTEVADEVKQRVESTIGRVVADVRIETRTYTAEDDRINIEVVDRSAAEAPDSAAGGDQAEEPGGDDD